MSAALREMVLAIRLLLRWPTLVACYVPQLFREDPPMPVVIVPTPLPEIPVRDRILALSTSVMEREIAKQRDQIARSNEIPTPSPDDSQVTRAIVSLRDTCRAEAQRVEAQKRDTERQAPPPG